MTDINTQIENIEKEIRETPYHKATEHHIGRLRARLSHLKSKQFEIKTKKGGSRIGYAVKKQGDATVCLVGAPSVGKSTLLNKLTNAKSKVAPYEFTTLSVIPGMMEYKNAKIQILDVPGLIEGAEIGKGRGREVLSVIRGSDLLILLCDINKIDSFSKIQKSLEKNGIKINQTPPRVTIEKKLKGGIQIISSVKQELSNRTIIEIANEFRIVNADIVIKEKLSIESLVDAFSQNKAYVDAIYAVNKIDLNKQLESETNNSYLYISAEEGINLDKLKEEIWKRLCFIRVYLVKKYEKPNENNPLIMREGDTLCDVAKKISDDFINEKNRATIWGPGSKFPGQEVSLSREIKEGMQIRFI